MIHINVLLKLPSIPLQGHRPTSMHTLEVNTKRLIGIHKAFILLNFSVQHLIDMRHYYTFLNLFICAMKKVNLKKSDLPLPE